ncbi:hypothetical protein EDD85DRAFT_963213 [Armillaria nabsnona]|nr:hypothetical protein EDD85DRAFT_963213 [Armillaria nabsnona]
MSYKDYRLYRTIQSPDFDSVNVLVFSKDCKLFAAGLENGAVITFHTDGGCQVAQYQKDAAAIDTILWSLGSDKVKDKDKPVLFVGTCTGKLFRYSRPDKKAKADRNIDWMASLEGPIRCIDYDSTNNYLIVGHGSQVSALCQNTLNDWRIVFDLKDLLFLMLTNFTRPPPFPTGVHVPQQNNTVIVSFLDYSIVAGRHRCYGLDHGDVMWNITPEHRIGNSATSTDGMMLVATNLYDGIDFYSCSMKRRGDQITDPILTNVIIPVRFIHDDEDILVGGSGGVASILNIAAKKSILTLKHSQTNDLIQSLAYAKLKGIKFIVTGNSEKGPDCKICLWVSYPPDWKPGPWYRIKSLWKASAVDLMSCDTCSLLQF